PIPLLLAIRILPIPSFIPPPTLPHIIIPPTNSTHATLFILPPPIPIPLIPILIHIPLPLLHKKLHPTHPSTKQLQTLT
ncbi:hypothetical protein, partial [Staphylococcus hominis]|uniref:hypothetical protein n=1 Tax=Staphylococcus hominis TaxID=1290 RepID=UPI0037097F15